MKRFITKVTKNKKKSKVKKVWYLVWLKLLILEDRPLWNHFCSVFVQFPRHCWPISSKSIENISFLAGFFSHSHSSQIFNTFHTCSFDLMKIPKLPFWFLLLCGCHQYNYYHLWFLLLWGGTMCFTDGWIHTYWNTSTVESRTQNKDQLMIGTCVSVTGKMSPL